MSDQPTLGQPKDGRQNSPIRDYLDSARRRRLWILLTTLGISLTIAVVALRLANIYRAETVIQVNPEVSEAIVQRAATEIVAEGLSSIRQEVMSPTEVGGLIKEMNLYSKVRGKVSDSVLIGRMIKSTSIELMDYSGRRRNSIRLAFTDTDRDLVAPVANRLASLFIEKSQKARETRIAGTSQLLDTELEQTKHQLEEKERLVQELKARATEVLPESKQYQATLNRLKEQLRHSQDQVRRDQQSKVYLQSMAVLVAPTPDLDQQSVPRKPPYQAELQKLEAQLKTMQTRYGPNYPDVRNLKREIDQLRARAESEKPKEEIAKRQPAPSQPGTRNPVVEAEVSKLDQDIANQTKIQADLEKQIQSYAEKLQQAPVFEQQMASLMHEYDTIQNQYNQLQTKKLEAEIAAEREVHEARERFAVLARAVPPEGPVGPRRGVMMGVGVLFGLLCGIGVAFLAEVSDKSVRHEREAAQIFGKPVLAGIPKITSLRERILSRWLVASITAGTAGAAVLAGLLLSRFVS